MPPDEWFKDGLQFECTGCGACCSGPEGYVLVRDHEQKAIAARLGLPLAAFREQYLHKLSLGWSLNEVKTRHGRDCVFLDRQSVPGKALCTIYEDRPLQCRTFPWWPENIKSPRAWQRLAKTCEGVGQGRLVPLSEISIERRKMIDDHQTAASRV